MSPDLCPCYPVIEATEKAISILGGPGRSPTPYWPHSQRDLPHKGPRTSLNWERQEERARHQGQRHRRQQTANHTGTSLLLAQLHK